jgi:hypothetical protein
MKDIYSSNYWYQTALCRKPEDHRMKVWLFHPITLLPDGLESELCYHTFVPTAERVGCSLFIFLPIF